MRSAPAWRTTTSIASRNGSKSSGFSPTPTNFTGCPVTCLIADGRTGACDRYANIEVSYLLQRLESEASPEQLLASVPGIGPELAKRIHELEAARGGPAWPAEHPASTRTAHSQRTQTSCHPAMTVPADTIAVVVESVRATSACASSRSRPISAKAQMPWPKPRAPAPGSTSTA